MPRLTDPGTDAPSIIEQILGVSSSQTVSPSAPATLGSAPTVSSTPTPGQGIALDAAGKLPAAILQLQVGYSLAYAELTSNATITATTEATANTVVTASPITLDGATAVRIEFYSYRTDRGTSLIAPTLYDAIGTGAAASIGILAVATATSQTLLLPRIYTPAAGVHTFSVRAFVDGGSGTVFSGAGGSGAGMPTYLRVTRA